MPELKAVVVGRGTDFQLQLGFRRQTSDLYAHTKRSVKVCGGNAVVTPGNALLAKPAQHYPRPYSLRKKVTNCIYSIVSAAFSDQGEHKFGINQLQLNRCLGKQNNTTE